MPYNILLHEYVCVYKIVTVWNRSGQTFTRQELLQIFSRCYGPLAISFIIQEVTPNCLEVNYWTASNVLSSPGIEQSLNY